MIAKAKHLIVLSIATISIIDIGVSFAQAKVWGRLFWKKSQYTPLLFFKMPNSATTDEMEKIISSVEKDLNVEVERFDVLRDRFARSLYQKIDEIEFVGEVPLLYHRESRQSIYGIDDKARVKAWAMGRWLTPKDEDTNVGKKERMGSLKEDEEQNEEDEMRDDGLTQLQKKGREKMLQRRNEGRR